MGRGHVVAVPMDRRTVGESGSGSSRHTRRGRCRPPRHRRRRNPPRSRALLHRPLGLRANRRSPVGPDAIPRGRRAKRDAARRRSRAATSAPAWLSAADRRTNIRRIGWVAAGSPATAGSRSAARSRPSARRGGRCGTWSPRPGATSSSSTSPPARRVRTTRPQGAVCPRPAAGDCRLHRHQLPV